MTPLELRAGLEQLLNRAETAERALAVAQRGLEEANLQVQRYATEAAVLTVRLENCRDIERRLIVQYLRGANFDGVIEEACVMAADAINAGAHRRGER